MKKHSRVKYRPEILSLVFENCNFESRNITFSVDKIFKDTESKLFAYPFSFSLLSQVSKEENHKVLKKRIENSPCKIGAIKIICNNSKQYDIPIRFDYDGSVKIYHGHTKYEFIKPVEIIPKNKSKKFSIKKLSEIELSDFRYTLLSSSTISLLLLPKTFVYIYFYMY